MKKTLAVFSAFLIFCLFTPAAHAVQEQILAQYLGSNDDPQNFGSTGGAPAMGQGFMSSINADVTVVCFYAERGSEWVPGQTVDITIARGADPGAIILDTETFDDSALPANGSPALTCFTLAAGPAITADTQYYVALRSNGGSSSYQINWYADRTSPNYTDGSAWYYLTSSSAWNDRGSAQDNNFEIRGTPAPGMPANPPCRAHP